MRRFASFIACGLMLYAAAAAGQTTLPTRADRPIADKSMVITDRGQKLEVYPTFRAKPELSGSHVRYRVSSTDADSPVGSTDMGCGIQPHHADGMLPHGGDRLSNERWRSPVRP